MAKEVRCPMCKQKFNLDDIYEKGDSVYCSECYEELIVVNLNPPRVGIVPGFSEEDYNEVEEQY